MKDEFYMQLALDRAWQYQGLTYPNPAVGAVVVMDGKILSIEAHQKAGTSHAEVLALISAYESISQSKINFDRFDAALAHSFLLSLPQNFFDTCAIFVTLEPCSHRGKTPSCATLLQILNLKEVIVGTRDPIVGHSNGLDMLTCNKKVGILQRACQELIEPFLIWQERAFVLFKIAQTSNGRIGGGYLSSRDSLEHTHHLRANIDTLLIGGNTVRADRPTLDCRFVGKEAPDIVIYSRAKEFDSKIPLFDVGSRNVSITDNLNFLKQPSFVLLEGGEGMLEAMGDRIDWMLIYQTPKLSTHQLSYNIATNLEFVHTQRKGVDLMIWSRKVGN